MTFALGEKFQGRYRIIRQIGSGGMSAVYEGVDERLKVTVAIKEIRALDEQVLRAFEREAQLLAQLNHPTLPRVSDYFTDSSHAFIVMQFIGGDDLGQILSHQAGPLPPTQVLPWAEQLLDALSYLHSKQIIHQDIKPQNLRLSRLGEIALVDFGLAQTDTPGQHPAEVTQSRGYTRLYAPLEQIRELSTSAQTDIYALGATLYHLLTAVKPPDALGRATAVADSKPDPLIPANEVHPQIGKDLAGVLQKAMALKASDRYSSAAEFREALRSSVREDLRQAEMTAETGSEPPHTPRLNHADLMKAIRRLRVEQKEALRDAISSTIEAEKAKRVRRSLAESLYGIAQPDGPIPSDEELKDDYIDYLAEKYS